jgi:two-component system LytT family response regulator
VDNNKALFRVAVVRGDPSAEKDITDFLRADGEVLIVGDQEDPRVDWAEISRLQTDILVVTLDCQNPELRAFSLKNAPGPPPFVIVIIADCTLALQALSLHAVDYLLLPFDAAAAHAAMGRAKLLATSWRHTHTHSADGALGVSGSYAKGLLRRILVKSNRNIHVVKVEQIRWIEAEGAYVCLHTGEGKHLLRGCIGALERSLPVEEFIRIHRSTIVNLENVQELHPMSFGDCTVLLDDGTRLIMSRSYREKFYQRFPLLESHLNSKTPAVPAFPIHPGGTIGSGVASSKRPRRHL